MYWRRGGANLDRVTVVIRRPILIVSAVLAGLLLLACGGSSGETSPTVAATGAPATAEAPAATPLESPSEVAATGSADDLPYATGPAVVVAAGYEPPDDRVDSTGAYLPSNGKPTLVFVDAIW